MDDISTCSESIQYPFGKMGLIDEKKKVDDFRNYVDSKRQDTVSRTYRLNHIYQTFDFVQQKKKQHLNFNKGKMSIWEAIQKLDDLVDDSDPDTDLPQIVHALQTAEGLREKYPEYDWLHLVGLLHDLGKILAHPDFGNEPQWCVVGDTFPVGCAYSEKIVYYEYLKENPDYHNSKYNTKYGVYTPNCGLDNVHFSWGHDEYMYQVCVHNGCKIPSYGLAIIRYHSAYPWHTGGDYKYLMDASDEEKLKWVLRFNKFDLYTKNAKLPRPVEELKPYYQGLINKYFPNPVLEW